MNNLALPFLSAVLMGLGATLVSDLWALFLKHAFKLTPSSMCLIGRWLRTMPEGTFKHANIGSAPPKSAECTVGWIAHYMIGLAFAIVFVAFAGSPWLEHPRLLPAIVFGVITVLAPFFIMQPAFGLGIAASKNVKSFAGKGSQSDEPYGVWPWSLPFRIAGPLAAIAEQIT